MTVRVREFTDPACPVAFSAEPVHLRIAWLYADHLTREQVMVVLSDGTRTSGGPPERIAAARRRRFALYGMPVDPQASAAAAGTLEASRLVVAARLTQPAMERPLLRRLRIHAMAGRGLDRASVEALAADAPTAVSAMDSPAVSDALAADMAAARDVSAAGMALRHRLGGGGSRYSTPSYRYEAAGRVFELVGIHPTEAHEAVLANLAPHLARRPDPESASEVLAWAGRPLATAEVAGVMRMTLGDTRRRLSEVATFVPSGLDGYWQAPGWASGDNDR